MLSSVSIVKFPNNINLLSQPIYASSFDSDDALLKSLKTDEGNISFSEDKYSYNIYVSDSTSSIKLKAKPENDEDFTVSINGAIIDEDDNYKMSVNLSEGGNYVPVKVKDDDGNSSTYNLYIYRGNYSSNNTSEGKIDNTQDDIYLEQLSIDEAGTYIKFRPNVTYYEINVDKDCDSIIVKAEPDESDYTVRINDNKVKEDNKYRKRVYLKEGKNEIKIRVDDKEEGDSYKDYDKRTYTLVVNRGSNNSDKSSITSDKSNLSQNNDKSNESVDESNKTNVKNIKWVKNEYGQWMYKDTAGNTIKNQWFNDIDSGKWYKFNNEGIMCTGFQYENGKTYYLNNDGSMQTGWKNIGGYWYLFRTDGSMVSKGWYQDSNGKWYYFYDGGVMASNIMIGNYTVGSDGALIR